MSEDLQSLVRECKHCGQAPVVSCLKEHERATVQHNCRYVALHLRMMPFPMVKKVIEAFNDEHGKPTV